MSMLNNSQKSQRLLKNLAISHCVCENHHRGDTHHWGMQDFACHFLWSVLLTDILLFTHMWKKASWIKTTWWDQPSETLLPQGWELDQWGKGFLFTNIKRARLGWVAKWSPSLLPQLVCCPSSALHPNLPLAVMGRRQDTQPAWLAELVPQEKWEDDSQQGHSSLLSLCPTAPNNCLLRPGLVLDLTSLTAFPHASFLICIINHTSTGCWWKCTQHPIMKVTHAKP